MIDVEDILQIVEITVGKKITFDENAHLVKDEILDSLDSSVYLLEVERKFGVKLDDETVEKFDLFSVSKMIDFLSKALEK